MTVRTDGDPHGRSLASLAGDPSLVESVLESTAHDPHALLGAHPWRHDGRDGTVVRAYHPAAVAAELHTGGCDKAMVRVDSRGLFAAFVPAITCEELGRSGYQLVFRHEDGSEERTADPYRFAPTLGELDLHLAAEGTHHRLFERLGAHPKTIDGIDGTAFAVWAPNARRVSVVGPFNAWDGRRHPMRQLGHTGIWELFVPGVGRGALYKYELKLRDGALRVKTDPLALSMELRPSSASIVYGLGDYRWSDQAWMARRRRSDPQREPLAIYEVHLGSWMRGEGDRWLGYAELAERLVAHCREHGFTHLELLPVSEHAFDPSWGYQTTGYYAPTSRFGEPDELRGFVDHCHRHGIGVLLDWVPSHFPKDDYALRRFDGTALYEHEDPREGEHRDWGTLIFNYGRNEVRAFLLSNAVYWLEQFHFDGLRVDAVASMLYRDYSREPGQWVPNRYGGRENLEAIDLLQRLNELVHEIFPGALTIAEESTAWPGVTAPVYLGGLGFDYKWNMGWMHDTLHYLSKEPIHRRYHHDALTFSMVYAYDENFVLPLSHDEVVHMKGSLLGKMPGDSWQRAANLRLLLCYLYAHPGKKLLFMGGEFGQRAEWSEQRSLDWHVAAEQPHAGIQRIVRDLGALYLARDALWAWDQDPRGFRWIDCHDVEQSIVSFVRSGPSGQLVWVFNFTPVVRRGYRIGVPAARGYRELLDSDGAAYGGGNVGNGGWVFADPLPWHGYSHSLALDLPPLGAIALEPEGDR